MENKEAQLVTRLHELWQQLRKPYINQEGKEDGVCLRSNLSSQEKNSIYKEQSALRDQLLTLRLDNPDYKQIRIGYSVAGWSEDHSYFRNKYDTFETLEEAKACLLLLKNDSQWRLPTVIVKTTFRLIKSPEPELFETAPVNQLGFADGQTVVVKDKMGSCSHTWDYLLLCPGNSGFYTY